MRTQMAITHYFAKRVRVIAVAIAPLLALVVGCEPQPPTDTDDVYDYVRNAKVGADVLRLDSEAQAYVNRIFHAYRKWDDRCAPIDDMADLSKLFAKDSDKWRETKLIAEQLATVEKWLADDRDPENENSKTRAEWRQVVLAAVDDMPSLPGGTSCRAGDLATAIVDELNINNRAEPLTRVAGLYKSVLSIATANADGTRASSKGLAFNDAAITEQALSAWDATQAALLSAREAEERDIDQVLTAGRELRDHAIADKRELRESDELTPEARRRKQRELELLVRYYDARIRWAENRQRELEPATEEDD